MLAPLNEHLPCAWGRVTLLRSLPAGDWTKLGGQCVSDGLFVRLRGRHELRQNHIPRAEPTGQFVEGSLDEHLGASGHLWLKAEGMNEEDPLLVFKLRIHAADQPDR